MELSLFCNCRVKALNKEPSHPSFIPTLEQPSSSSGPRGP